MVPGEMDLDCFICSKHRNAQQLPGGAIYEDELVYVGHIGSNEKTVYLGYLVIDLKRHVPGLGDMTLEESRAIGETLNCVSIALRKTQHAEHVYAYVQGDAVPHVHIHVIPRYPNTPESYWGPMKIVSWPGAKRGGEAEVNKCCSELRSFLICQNNRLSG